jgi:hypothetical protein
LATELCTELNTAVTAINDLTDRLEATDNLLGAVDDRLNEHLNSAHGETTHQQSNNTVTTDALTLFEPPWTHASTPHQHAWRASISL